MGNIRFGANYIPSKNWLHNWVNWDPVSVEEDLISTKALGADHIRANLLWPYFQLNPYVMSEVALKNLKEFMAICDKVGIDCCLTLFTGWMSGSFFFPAWQQKITGAFGEGIFSHPEMIKAEEYYIREIAKVVVDSKSFMGFDLGNELSVLVFYDKTAKIEECDAWHKRMLNLCEEVAPGKLHNNGVDHMPWFIGVGFSREVLVNTGRISAIHAYSEFTEALKRFGKMSTESIHLAPFMMEMSKAFAEDKDRLYWIQEFGTAARGFDKESEKFVEESIRAMYTSDNLWGITWWCTHNLPKGYTAFEDLEFELGLLDSDNKPTPAGLVFKRIVEDYKKNGAQVPEHKAAFVLKATDSNGAITPDVIWENGKIYAEFVEKGIYPAIVLPEKATDAEYLKSRGIEKVYGI